jgi:hypothetical protein
MEIDFKELQPEQKLLIRTQNSEYRFRVIDPDERRGMLTGGSLGGNRREAVLIGTLPDGSYIEAANVNTLKIGTRALFFLGANRGVERLITSAITEIATEPGRDSSRQAA